MRRKRMKKSKSKRLFRKTAGSRGKNHSRPSMRGGFRL